MPVLKKPLYRIWEWLEWANGVDVFDWLPSRRRARRMQLERILEMDRELESGWMQRYVEAAQAHVMQTNENEVLVQEICKF